MGMRARATVFVAVLVVAMGLLACGGGSLEPASLVVSFPSGLPTGTVEPTATPVVTRPVTLVPRPFPTAVPLPEVTVVPTAEPESDDGEGELFGLEPLRDPTPTAGLGATPDLRVPHVERYFRDEYRGGSARRSPGIGRSSRNTGWIRRASSTGWGVSSRRSVTTWWRRSTSGG